jgi:hypothetical protein
VPAVWTGAAPAEFPVAITDAMVDVAAMRPVAEAVLPSADGEAEPEADAEAEADWHTGAVLILMFWTLHIWVANFVVAAAFVSNGKSKIWYVDVPSISAFEHLEITQHDRLSMIAVLPQKHARSVGLQPPSEPEKQLCYDRIQYVLPVKTSKHLQRIEGLN